MTRCSQLLTPMLLAAALPLFLLTLPGCPPPDNPRAPEAGFSATPREGLLPLSVQFNDTSLPGTSAIRSWSWSFGDGATSRLPSPRHEYTAPGTYTVRLTVESAEGSDTMEREDYITVIERESFAFIDGAGGRVSLGGIAVDVPAGAFTRPVAVGVIYEEAPFSAAFPETIQVISPAYSISHGSNVTRVHAGNPGTGGITPTRIEMTFRPDLVPTGDRNGRKIHILATLPSGESIPLFGTVTANRITVPVAGLPPRATYGVVYRPGVERLLVTVDPPSGKALTGPVWLRDWSLFSSPRLIRELTALRLGTPLNPEPYGRLDFTAGEIELTEVMLAMAISRVALAYEEAGLRSPALTASDGAYPVAFYHFASGYNPDFTDFSALRPFTTVFGTVAIDPAQLLNVARHHAARVASNPNLDQELDFEKAFAQAAYEAAFAGYGLPAITADNGPQNEKDIPFASALSQGAGIYFGQVLGGLPTARGFGPNEVASLSEPLFAAFSAETPVYAAAGQDFLFFLDAVFGASLLDVFMSADPTQLGLLEYLRLELARENPTTFGEAARSMREAIDDTLSDFLGDSLGSLYWEFARARGVEMVGPGVLRPSDETREPFTLQRDLFRETGVLEAAFMGTSTQLQLGGDRLPALAQVPPLTSRAILIDIDPTTPDLTFTFNRADWQTGRGSHSVAVKVYGEGGDGVELGAEASTVVLNPSGVPASEGVVSGLGGVVVLLSNLSLDAANSIYVNVTRPAP